MIKNKKVLVTGATGFIGANLTRMFIEIGAKVYIFTRPTSKKWRINDILKEVREYGVDLLDFDRLQQSILEIKPDIIVHTAVYGGYPFQKNEIDIILNNIIGTVNLVNACTRVEFECFINTGSSSEYGFKTKPMVEENLPEPIDTYGISKLSSTLYCQMKAKNENLPIATLRLFSPYGYYEEKTRLIPYVINCCLTERNPRLSSPNPVRDFVFIEDVLTAYAKAIELIENIKGEVLNIGFGKQYSVKEVVNEILELTGGKVKPEWGTIANPRKEPNYWQADISKAREKLKWQPTYDLRKGLKKTIEWFKLNMELYKDEY
ncbi:MAG: NAD(P)-dependent oxidoreductase [Candidatus Omnitrophica bacterium]|nr:NAD(P)-dependent oxidoreductase [Candidatus Omnitrophota bacterium]